MDFRNYQKTKYGNKLKVSESSKDSFIDKELNSRKERNQFRKLQALMPDKNGPAVEKNGKRLINFCSNDYLGLSRHPELVRKSKEYAEQYGAGSTASRLVSGTYTIHERLEDKIAQTFDTEAALLLNSGFQANSTIISTLTNRHSLVLADKLSHNSLLQGALLSRADLLRFEHNDLEHLEELLIEAEDQSYNRILIITETVFSMDGDRSDVSAISDLADAYNALLFVDDAHAVGVWGENGLGLGNMIPGIDILLGTCGKAFGSFGAYVACSEKMKDYLVNFCPGVIYTTALPPSTIGAIDAALEVIPSLNEERAAYHQKIRLVKDELNAVGFDTGPSTTQIIPVIIGDEQETLGLAKWLEGEGILATAIRPPTVPTNSSRIRITLSSAHTDDHINYLLQKLGEWKNAGS